MAGELPEFRVLGPLEVSVSGRKIELGSPKQRAVLGVLLANAPRPVSVSRLTEEVWGQEAPADPRRSLQVYVSALRRALGAAAPMLVTEGRSYRLQVPAGRVDAERFEGDVAEAARLFAAGEPREAVDLATSALHLWRGEAWQDLRDLPGIEPLAARLAERRLDAESVRVQAMLSLGRHREVLPELEQLVLEHPLREDLRGPLMLSLHRCGRQIDALAVYAAGRVAKVAESGLEPGAALRQLQSAILADDPGLAVEDAAVGTRRHLPAQVNQLIGREIEVDEAAQLLRGAGCRLLTLTGPGGIGKTRVGLEVARHLAADFADGVWFVALDAVSDHRLVPQAVAEALGVDDVGGEFLNPLREHLAARHLLLLLDNFEQVDEAAPVLTELLAAAGGLRILVTSRTRLRVYGENVRVLEPLRAEAAVPLFLERARSADHRVDGSATDEVFRVCESLDRLPLAIELVAARAGEVSFAQMTAQLGSPLDLATHGPRDRTPRQQTLRNAITWSVDLLSPAEASAFGRLGMFVGGFEESAASVVAGASAEILSELVRASLVQPGEEGRYRLLETVREYAVEMAGNEVDRLRDAHADYFLTLAEAAVQGMRGPEQGTWTARLHAERGNLRAAFQRLLETAADDEPEGERLLRMAGSMGLFWYRTSPGSEDVEWLPRALAVAPGAAASLRGRALHGLAICRGEQGRSDEALEHSRQAYLLLRDAGDPAWAARALNTLAGVTRDLGRSAEAAPLMEESIALRRSLDDPALPLTVALANRAMVALDVGDLDRARDCLEECLALAKADHLDQALVRIGLADVALEAGDVAQSVALLRDAIPVVSDQAPRYRLIESLDTFAALAVRRGLLEVAAALVTVADREVAESGAIQVVADLGFRERRIGKFLRAMDPATSARAAETGRDLSLEQAVNLVVQALL